MACPWVIIGGLNVLLNVNDKYRGLEMGNPNNVTFIGFINILRVLTWAFMVTHTIGIMKDMMLKLQKKD